MGKHTAPTSPTKTTKKPKPLSCVYTDEVYTDVAFEDIQTSLYRSSIQALVDACIIKTSTTTFNPREEISLGAFLKILTKSALLSGGEWDIDKTDTSILSPYMLMGPKSFDPYIAKALEM
jgi:hypothetical protein